ncbi:MAG: hypothetical protein ACYC63_00365 [Armatimonadota bacterium]
MRHRDVVHPVLLLAVWLLLTTTASAQSLPGLWGSSFHRVQLSVSGNTVTGTFTSLDDPQAPAGKISGRLEPGGRAFTADWTFPTGPETGAFKTYLSLGSRDGVLSGYRWTDEAQPTSFALHRAVNGALVQVIDQDTPTSSVGGTAGGATGGTIGGTSGGTTGGTTTPVAGRLEVITCENVLNGQPQNAADRFTAPKSIVTMVRYTNLPPNSTVDWLWTMDSRTESKLTKVLSGTGWHSHGLRSDTGIVPGSYLVTVSLNGRPVARRTILVRARGGTTSTAPTSSNSPANQSRVEIILCEGAPGGIPKNPGTQFTKPASLIGLLNYRNLPANSELKWVWLRPNGQTTPYVKTVSGTGWATHGFTSTTAMSPGTYKVTIYAAGKLVRAVTAVVR